MSAKGNRKNLKYESLYIEVYTTNGKCKMYDLTAKNWSHWNSNERLEEKFETILEKYSIDSLLNTDVLGTLHTPYEKYCSLKLEPRAGGINFVLRAEVLGGKSSDKRCHNNNNSNVGFKTIG
jgi:hypothetical protein